MADHLAPAKRSRNMALIKSKNTLPELAVRRIATSLGYRYRLHRSDLPGRPDLVFPSRRAVVIVNGCFWHQHSAATCKARPPKSNRIYWIPKLRRNVERDKRNQNRLRKLGWRILVVWECQLQDKKRLCRRIHRFLDPTL